jgi:cell division protein FtsQ
VTSTAIRRRELLRAPLAFLRAHPRIVAGIVASVVVLGFGWMWLRDSSLVAVRQVTVSGIGNGPDAGKIRRALVAAARSMTTLDVQMPALDTAVEPFPVVKHLRVTAQFPHGMTIRVVEQVPIAAIVAAGRTTAVTAGGTLLHDVIANSSLPSIPVGVPPAGSRLTDPSALAALAVLGAAPYALLSHVTQVTQDPRHGLVAQLTNGPSVYFGDTTDLQEKWASAEKALVDPGTAGASYIDVSDPGRPADGSTAPPTTTTSASPSAGTGSAAPSGSGTGASPAATASGTTGSASTGAASSATTTGSASTGAASSTTTIGG